jgi:hypothetical protein
MKAVLASATLVALFTLVPASTVLAQGGCSMNSNKPCPPPDKSIAKEPAYSMNSNKPAAQQASAAPEVAAPPAAPARAQVQAPEEGETAAKATLTGINPNDLKLKPKVPKTSEKEQLPR